MSIQWMRRSFGLISPKQKAIVLKEGKAMGGFMPAWIGEFYAYYQWFYGLSSAELVKKIPVSFLKKAYAGLHDLELDLAVKKSRRSVMTVICFHNNNEEKWIL